MLPKKRTPIVTEQSFATNLMPLTVTVSVQTYDSVGSAVGSPVSASLTVTADEAPEGQRFSHWTIEDGTIVSYNAIWSFYAERNIALTANYAADPEPVGTTFMMNMTEDPANKKLSFVSVSTVPEGCTILMAGVLATDDAAVGTDPDSFDETTAKFVRGSAWSGSCYRYTWTKTKVEPGTVWYARAYLVYRDENGNTHTVYGAPVQNSYN